MSYVDEFETACNFTRTCFTTFSLDEIKNLSGIISRLRQQSDAVSAFLWKGLSAPDQQILTEHQPSQPTSKQAHITNEQASELVYNEALQEVLRSTREISFHVWLTIATREIIDVTYISSLVKGGNLNPSLEASLREVLNCDASLEGKILCGHADQIALIHKLTYHPIVVGFDYLVRIGAVHGREMG